MHTRNVFFLSIALSLTLCSTTGAQQPERDVAYALGRLASNSAAVRWQSITALARAGESAVPALIAGLAESSAYVRAGSATALGMIGPTARTAEGALAAVLTDREARVREEAAVALGVISRGDERTVTALTQCLSDREPFVIGKAAGALARIGAPAIPSLVRVLRDSSRAARNAATIALGKMGPGAAPATAALIITLGDESADVRYGAAHALGGIGTAAREAVPALLGTLSDPDQDVRSATSLALDRIDPSALVQRDWHAVASIIDTLTPRLMREAHVPGISITVIQKKAIVWSKQYGVSNITTGTAVSDSTMFEACSMSKPVLAVIALRLAERKRLDLDRPLVHYLALPSMQGQPGHERITARMALSHTTGLPNWRRGEEERDGPLPVNFPPGSRFGYSGEAIYYLQQVIEKITGEPIDILADREIFLPAGLRHMSFTWNEGVTGLIAAGHTAEGKYNTTTRYTHGNAAYTLYTSAADYARFLIMLMNPGSDAGLLTAGSTTAMLKHQVPVPAREPMERPGRARATAVYWGLGWGINETDQGDIIHHSGSNQSGFRCFSQFNPATGSGIVIMTNGANGTDVWVRLINRIGNL